MRKALLVGIDEYKPPFRLQGCVQDAKNMRAVLCDDPANSTNFACQTLISEDDTITEELLHEHIERLFADPADVALFFFAGHGLINKVGLGYLVTLYGHTYNRGISLDLLVAYAARSPAKEKIIILDCCFSGNVGNLPALGPENALIPKGVSILASSSENQVAAGRPSGGIFTSMVVEALKGGATDLLGNVTVGDIYRYVDQLLDAWDQRPLFKANISRSIPIKKYPAKIEPAILRKLPDYFEEKDYHFPLDPGYDPELPPSDPEKEAIMAEFRILLKQGLLAPIGEEYMYHAAKNSRHCGLTPLGEFYRQMVVRGKV